MLISGPPIIATGIALGCRSCANRSMSPYALTLKRYIFKPAILVQRESSVYSCFRFFSAASFFLHF
jgi:hypothetical protein